MHRVELKVLKMIETLLDDGVFLMHRVELKEGILGFSCGTSKGVPNAPCGVEREDGQAGHERRRVPNAPCGVESKLDRAKSSLHLSRS